MAKSLFGNNTEIAKPLAVRLRPTTLKDFVGQEKLLAEGKVLRKLIEQKKLSNCIFYGPSGVGKTSLGEIISKELSYNFETLNATTSGVADLKEVIERARKNLEFHGKKTILFLDEIHRFNKLQQDSLLSSTESGVIILIGATTENPYYNLNNALLSRVLLFEFKPLSDENIKTIVRRGLKYLEFENIQEDIVDIIAEISKGDSRVALNYLELYGSVGRDLSKEELIEIFSERRASYHKEEDKYNLISAMIKSIRGSDPDAALYWMGRLLAGGEDPKFIARRLLISASEDIGMANPEAMLVANVAITATERIGMPEVRIILGQTIIYLAISTKSSSSYLGINRALEDIEKGDLEVVPSHIDSQGRGYKYPHDYEGNFVKQVYTTKKRNYYVPQDNKYEKLIKERLEKLWDKKY